MYVDEGWARRTEKNTGAIGLILMFIGMILFFISMVGIYFYNIVAGMILTSLSVTIISIAAYHVGMRDVFIIAHKKLK